MFGFFDPLPPLVTVAKPQILFLLSAFLGPPPLVAVTNQLILLLPSAFKDPPWPPHPLDVIYGSPLAALR